jgi:tetratricopeptide (TPR) repeat protein
MSLSADEVRSEIEAHVRARNTIQARRLISLYLRKYPDEGLIRIDISEWLRRLGDYRKALHVLQPAVLMSEPKSGPVRGKALIQMALILNYLGANESALKIAKSVNPSDFDDIKKIAQIYLDQFEYPLAHGLLKKGLTLDSNPKSYASRLVKLAFADSSSGLGLHDEALKMSEVILSETKEPLLLGICLEARGEYFTRAGKIDLAFKELKKAEPYFPTHENTPDSALLYKWLGYVSAVQGDRDQAIKCFLKAERILFQPALRIEAFFDLLRLKRRVEMLSNIQWKRVLHYPGLPTGFLALLKEECDASLLENAYFGCPEKSAAIFIDLRRQEIRVNHRCYYGVPIELRCLADLVIASDWGISSVRMQALLWPDEAFSFIQLQKRLEGILHRLRKKYAVKMEIEEGQIRLDSGALKKIGVASGSGLLPSLLVGKKEFMRADVEKYYSVSETQAKGYLQAWTQKGWLSKKENGPKTLYLCIF